MKMINKLPLRQAYVEIKDHRIPFLVGDVNGCKIKLLKVQGRFAWHSHENKDKMILVISGCFKIHLEDQEITLTENEILIIPQKIMHSATACSETWIMLIE